MNKLAFVLIVLLTTCWPIYGNDSAASTALGGIQLRREPRIAMLKERLFISTEKVTVEYEFLNESDRDITTEVAFPIPPYKINFSAGGIRMFDDFKLWVDGAPVEYETEAKAWLNGKDYSRLLLKNHIDIATLGHFVDDKEPSSADFVKLSSEAQRELLKEGLFDDLPEWEVHKTYHWRQSFPAHKILHVRHEYRPGVGFTPVETNLFSQEGLTERKSEANEWFYDEKKQIDDACVEPRLMKALSSANQADPGPGEHYDPGYVHMAWVDYILTTANSWKTPIKDFELIVDKQDRYWHTSYVSFCWDGPVEKIDATRFRARVTDFVPKRELHVAFFYIR